MLVFVQQLTNSIFTLQEAAKNGPLATTLFVGNFTKCCRCIFNIHHV